MGGSRRLEGLESQEELGTMQSSLAWVAVMCVVATHWVVLPPTSDRRATKRPLPGFQ